MDFRAGTEHWPALVAAVEEWGPRGRIQEPVGLERKQRDVFSSMRGNNLELCQGMFSLDINENFFTKSIVKYWTSFSGRGGVLILGSVQDMCGCGSWGHGAGWWLDLMISEVFANFRGSVTFITMGKASWGNTAPQMCEPGAAGPQAHVGGVQLSSKLLEIPEWEEKSVLMCLPGP